MLEVGQIFVIHRISIQVMFFGHCMTIYLHCTYAYILYSAYL